MSGRSVPGMCSPCRFASNLDTLPRCPVTVPPLKIRTRSAAQRPAWPSDGSESHSAACPRSRCPDGEGRLSAPHLSGFEVQPPSAAGPPGVQDGEGGQGGPSQLHPGEGRTGKHREDRPGTFPEPSPTLGCASRLLGRPAPARSREDKREDRASSPGGTSRRTFERPRFHAAPPTLLVPEVCTIRP